MQLEAQIYKPAGLPRKEGHMKLNLNLTMIERTNISYGLIY